MLRQDSKQRVVNERRRPCQGSRGVTLPELLIGMLVAAILTAVAIPMYNSAMMNLRMSSMAGAISGAISSARYQAVMNSQIYTIVVSAPGNSYVVKNATTGVAGPAVPLPSSIIAVNGGAAATYTFTLCPNGTVYGSGGACPGTSAPPALALTYQTREIDINVSGVGNVSTKTIH